MASLVMLASFFFLVRFLSVLEFCPNSQKLCGEVQFVWLFKNIGSLVVVGV